MITVFAPIAYLHLRLEGRLQSAGTTCRSLTLRPSRSIYPTRAKSRGRMTRPEAKFRSPLRRCAPLSRPELEQVEQDGARSRAAIASCRSPESSRSARLRRHYESTTHRLPRQSAALAHSAHPATPPFPLGAQSRKAGRGCFCSASVARGCLREGDAFKIRSPLLIPDPIVAFEIVLKWSDCARDSARRQATKD